MSGQQRSRDSKEPLAPALVALPQLRTMPQARDFPALSSPQKSGVVNRSASRRDREAANDSDLHWWPAHSCREKPGPAIISVSRYSSFGATSPLLLQQEIDPLLIGKRDVDLSVTIDVDGLELSADAGVAASGDFVADELRS